MASFAGWNAPEHVRAKLQASLYWARRQRVARIPVPEPPPVDEHWENVELLVFGDTLANPVDRSKNELEATIANIEVVDGEFHAAGAGGKVAFASHVAFRVPLVYTIEFDITFDEAELGAMYFFGPSAGNYLYGSSNGSVPVMTATYGNKLATSGEGAPDAYGEKARVAYTRDDQGVRRLFRDGVLVYTESAQTTTDANAQPFDLFGIPGRPDLAQFRGKFSNIRITHGVCRYTEDYTPPVRFPDRGPT